MMIDPREKMKNLSPEKRLQLLEKLREKNRRTRQDAGIPRRPVGQPLPLSFSQERLWFLDQLEPGSAFYNISLAIRLRGPLNPEILEHCFNLLVERHESLRTTFKSEDGQVRQVIAPMLAIALPLQDVSHEPERQREASVQWHALSSARQPFNLVQGPLLRAQLFRLSEQEHIFILIVHHSIADGWSMGVLVQELSALYVASEQGQASPLPDLTLQYADYAAWQRERLQGDLLAHYLTYWKQQLSNAPALLDLPSDRKRPVVQSHAGAREGISLTPEISRSIKHVSQQEGVTPFMVLLAAWGIFLGRLSGQEDLVIGSPIAGRQHQELEALIGFFVNTLALRVDLSGQPSFKQVLERVRRVTLDAYDHQEVPFEKLVEELAPQRDRSHQPLFNVMFILQNIPVTFSSATGLSIEPVVIDNQTAKYDLVLTLSETSAGQFEGFLEYSTDLFEANTIQQWLQQWPSLLERMLFHREKPLTSFSLLSEQERTLILKTWNANTYPLPELQDLVALFEAQVQKTPQAPALLFEDKALSYQELNARANQLARLLRRQGIGDEARVGICLARTPEQIITLLGVLKAGGAYIPLDPNISEKRLAFLLHNAQAHLLITRSELADHIAANETPRFFLDQQQEALREESSEDLGIVIYPQNLAYVLYTSGSTGQPKGVMGTHQGIVNRVQWMWHTYPFTEGEVCCQKTSLSFVDAVAELFTPLLAGIPTVLVPDEQSKDAAALLRVLIERRVSRLVLVPSLLRTLLSLEPELGALVPQLRLWMCSGETLPTDLWQHFRQVLPERQLLNIYGSSEVAADATTYEAQSQEESIPIGRPLDNMCVYVLDQQGQPAGIGVPGEIVIGGLGLARGYIRQPDLTAERFLPDSVSGEMGTRLYRTGDRGRYRANGVLEYIGRQDQQIKLRGFRIELGEIEAALHTVSGVDTGAVLVHERVQSDPLLVAFVEVQPGATVTQEQVRTDLRECLPGYMLPNRIVILEQMPRTTSGKIDRMALPDLFELFGEAHESYVAPRTPLEKELADIWAEVLHLPRVGLYDNFFALGGHSLLATQIVARIRERFALDLPLHRLFEATTLADLAELMVMQQGTDQPSVQRQSFRIAERNSLLPLSFTQERMWFLDRLEPGSPFYNLSASVRLLGPLHAHLLEKSLNALVQRHESLRTTFVQVDGRVGQVIAAGLTIPLLFHDVSKEPEGQCQDSALQLVQRAARQSFDLTCGPLLNAEIIRLSEQEHILALTMHHIISDGWSMGILVQELSTFYAAFTQEISPQLPALPIQYADYAVWQREQLQGEVLEEQQVYWSGMLAGAPALLALPTDRPRPSVQTYRGAKKTLTLSFEMSQAIKTFSRETGITPFMILFSAWAILLGRLSKQDDLVIGSPIAGRQRKELETLIGFFINTLALRIDLSGNPTFQQVLEQVRDVALGAYEHQELPFDKLIEEVAPHRDLSHQPLVQVMFILQNMPTSTLHASDLTMQSISTDNHTAKYDIELSLFESATGSFTGYVEYSSDLFDGSTIERWLQQWQHVLEQGLQNSEQTYDQISLLQAQERESLVRTCGSVTQTTLPSEVQRLFALHPSSLYRLQDEQGHVVPIGVVGELYIDDSKSIDALPHRTGRLLRYCVDGTLDYIGHRTEQVFIDGYTLNLHEIEQELIRLPGVRACVVRTKEQAEGDLELIAYVELQDRMLTAEQVRRALKERVPGYKMPARFVCLEQLPRTANGKVDYAALPEPSESKGADQIPVGRPRTPVEETLVAIWADVLQVEMVGIYDNFFDLGGHSLLATQVVARVGEAFNTQLGSMSAEVEGEFINALFEEPTIAALALLIETVWQRELGVQLPVLEPVGREESLPLSFTQERMWFLDQLEPGNAFYNISAAIRLRGPLDASALEQSLNRLIVRHESLRTTFALVDGVPRQVIAPHLSLHLHRQDVSDQPAEQREAFAQQQAVEMAQISFDLERGPLLRAQLYTLQAQEHVLVLTMHHIISDGWSMGVFLREFTQLYVATVQGQPATLPELPIQYGDYAVWQRTWLQGEALDYQIEYWQSMLVGAPVLLHLPTDYSRPPNQSYRGAKVLFQLSPDISQAIKQVSRSEGITPFMLLLTAWAILLGRLSGQEDLVIGSPVAGRKRVELEGLIGFFVNTLALRVDLSDDPTFQEVLERVRTMALGAYAHQELPFEKLVEELAPQRDLSYHPLFQAMFILQNTPRASITFSDVSMQHIEIDNQTAKFDLTLELIDQEKAFDGHVEYNTDLFEYTTVQRWVQQLQHLLHEALLDIEQPISHLSLEDEQEQLCLLAEWNTSELELPSTQNVVALFEEQVQKTPQAPALLFRTEQVCYEELNARANQLAHILRRRGIGGEMRVGICLPRTPDLIVAQLAVLKVGGAYVLFDPALPEERIAFMLHDSQAQFVITLSVLAEHIYVDEIPLYRLDQGQAELSQESTENLKLSILPQQLAYVLYTSGSTSQPKGVMGTHQGVVNRVQWAWQTYPFTDGEICCLKTSLSFVDGVAELFTPLLAGVPLVLVPDEQSKDPAQLLAVLVEKRVTRLVLVPSLLRTFFALAPDLAARLPNLHLWMCSGEVFPLDLWKLFRSVLGERVLVNVYGSTEVSADATAYQPQVYEENVPIGRPLSNVRTYVLDPQGCLVPVGVIGEIAIGGLGVARGYIQQSALTAERFIPDAYSGDLGARLYWTGDLGRYRADGVLEYVGRRDQQIKLRGFRIEPGEIEWALSQVPGVQSGVVLVETQASSSEELLLACVEAQRGTSLSPEQLRVAMKKILPAYMLPNRYIILERLPLTASGKIDRVALPELVQEMLIEQMDYVGPRTPAEEAIAAIWSEVLQCEQVGVHDNFFELGGHSLLATQVSARIHERLHIDLPLHRLFEYATLSDLANLIVEEQMKQLDSNVLAQMLAEVSQLSQEELQMVLADEEQGMRG